VREIMLLLHAHGVGTSRAVRIYKTYGAEAVAVISENPYRLARDIRTINFKTADQVAAKLGAAKDATVRVRAGVSYALDERFEHREAIRSERRLVDTDRHRPAARAKCNSLQKDAPDDGSHARCCRSAAAPHGRDAMRHQRERRHPRRLDPVADGLGRWHLRGTSKPGSRRHQQHRGNALPACCRGW